MPESDPAQERWHESEVVAARLRIGHVVMTAWLLFCGLPPAGHADEGYRPEVSGNAEVSAFMQAFNGRGVMADDSQPTP
ncbi:MAG: hypothetical protein AAGD07_18050, partial [Planctomycetota bacterium]